MYFIQKWQERGLEHTSFKKNERTANRFLQWIQNRNLQHHAAEILNIRHIEDYLSQMKKVNNWGNRSYNNERGFLSTMFTFFKKHSIVKDNPCELVDKQVALSKKHLYYDEKLFSKIKNILAERDPYLLFACQVAYYLCIRSEKELKHFKVGNIFPDRMQVMITAAESKTNADRYIPMCDEMLKIF